MPPTLIETDGFWNGASFAEKEHTFSSGCTGMQCQYIPGDQECVSICPFIQCLWSISCGAGWKNTMGRLNDNWDIVSVLKSLGADTNISDKRYHVLSLYKRHKPIALRDSDMSKNTSDWNQMYRSNEGVGVGGTQQDFLFCTGSLQPALLSQWSPPLFPSHLKPNKLKLT